MPKRWIGGRTRAGRRRRGSVRLIAPLSRVGLRLPGTAGNYASSPDSVLNSVTGDLDARWYGKLDDWTPAANNTLLAKYDTGGNQRSWRFYVAPTGKVNYSWSQDGVTPNTVTTTWTPSYVDGSPHWLRISHDVDDGSGHNVVRIYDSDDGLTWTLQHTSTDAGVAGVVSRFDSTAPLTIGAFLAGGSPSELMTGTAYYAEVRNGIDGPIAARFDSSQVQVSGSQLPASINGWTWNGSALYKRDDYVKLPGANTDFLSYPGTATNTITGDIDVRIKLSTDWATASGPTAGNRAMICQHGGGGFVGWEFRSKADTLYLEYSLDGSATKSRTSGSLGFADGIIKWVRFTRVVSTGVVVFYASDDGVTWSVVTTMAALDAGSPFFSQQAQPIRIGKRGDGLACPGNVYYAEVRNGINGPVVASFNAVDNQIQTPWTINGSAWNWEGASFTGKPGIAYLLPTPAVINNFVSAPDTPAYPLGDIDIRARVAPAKWVPTTSNGQTIIGRWLTGTTRSFGLNLTVTDGVELMMSSDGTNQFFGSRGSAAFTTAHVDGQPLWIRCTRTQADGVTSFYFSTDGTAWVPIGTSTIVAAGSALFDSPDVLYLGANNTSGGRQFEGKIYYAEIRNGIDGPIVAKFDPTNIAKTGTRTPASTVQPGGTPNMLTPNEASIETDASGWTTTINATVAQDATQSLDGTKSLAMTNTAGAAAMQVTLARSGANGIPVVAGKAYVARASFKAATTGRTSCRPQINWFTAAGGYISTSDTTNINDLTTGWVEAGGSLVVAPATAAFASLILRVGDGAQGASEVHYVDRISLVEAANAWTMNGTAWDLVAA